MLVKDSGIQLAVYIYFNLPCYALICCVYRINWKHVLHIIYVLVHPIRPYYLRNFFGI
jgi:hypothetical protein